MADYSEYLKFIKKDFRRFESAGEAIGSASFAISFWFRIATWLFYKNKFFKILGIPVYIWYKLLKLLTGIQLPIGTKIGPGLRFFHYNCIILATETEIGDNVSIHQGVTLGRVFNGQKEGVPKIGDNVVISAGAKIVGNVRIGDNVVIGANAVVVNDIPANCVCVGSPAKIVSEDSSKCFNPKWTKIFWPQ